MIKYYFKRAIALTMISESLLTLNPSGASAQWKQDSKGWWYAEGISYAKDKWKQIGVNWYYFDNSGYIVKNKIIDDYYLDSNGVWSTGPKEIQAYERILTNHKLLKEKYGLSISDYNINSNSPYQAEILDIDKDGIYEALVHNETSHSNAKTSVFTYKNGEIQLAGHIGNNTYYSENQNALLGGVMFMGEATGGVYKLENGTLNKTHSFKIIFNSFKESYEIDGKYVTKEQSNNFFKQYGATPWIRE